MALQMITFKALKRMKLFCPLHLVIEINVQFAMLIALQKLQDSHKSMWLLTTRLNPAFPAMTHMHPILHQLLADASHVTGVLLAQKLYLRIAI
jgi:hypothetical protein